MPTIRELHQAAMDLADESFIARQTGQPFNLARDHRAFELERAAADQLADQIDAVVEPTRSILYRSAAWLAIHAGELGEAIRLADLGLGGALKASNAIAQELQEARTVAMALHTVVAGAPVPIPWHPALLDVLITAVGDEEHVQAAAVALVIASYTPGKYDSYRPICPTCGCNVLHVVALTLLMTGERREHLELPLTPSGFELTNLSVLRDMSTEDELVRCQRCHDVFALSDITLAC